MMAGQNNDGIVYLTRERLLELERELHRLKVKGRAEIAQQIAEARGHGDLSENSEYDAAKQAQEMLEIRISKLEQTLSRARIIDAKDLPNDKVYILSSVRIKDLRSGEELTYKLVSPEEANFEQNKISVNSPIGKGLMGKIKGEVVKINVPAGTLDYQILEIGK
ncbi:MAG: transcription elongation factor GreA [Bacteroidota bacterium]